MFSPAMSMLPGFSYDLSLSSVEYRWITAGTEKIHYIHDVSGFFFFLGYTEEAHSSGLFFEEWVWERFISPSAPKARYCLQALIAAYLHTYSDAFRKRYGVEYESTFGKCGQACLDSSDVQCASCPQLPNLSAS